MSRTKPGFVLDCVNIYSNKMPQYNGLQDNHLERFLRMKGFRRNILRLKKQLSRDAAEEARGKLKIRLARKKLCASKEVAKSMDQELPKIKKRSQKNSPKLKKRKIGLKLKTDMDVSRSIYSTGEGDFQKIVKQPIKHPKLKLEPVSGEQLKKLLNRYKQLTTSSSKIIINTKL